MSPQRSTVESPSHSATRLSVVLPHTDLALTRAALGEASRLAHGLHARVTVLAVRVIPFPEPLDPSRSFPGLQELIALAESAEMPVTINIVYARDWDAACEQALDNGALVVIALRRSWLRTREERLAAHLTRTGHTVATVAA
jgi:hypothetical protein